MNGEVLAVGEKVHIITRRLFAEDVRRHFAGVITSISDDRIRVEGFAFIFNAGSNEYRKRSDKRTRIFSISSMGSIVNVIPAEVDIDSLHYAMLEGRMVVSDGGSFALDINEFGFSA